LLGGIGISMLVLLRLTIGWHFYGEGLEKYQSGKFDAAPFFANAKGPFAEHYRALVWDWDGRLRLDRDLTLTWWDGYRDGIAAHYGFDERQSKAAKSNFENARDQYDWVLEQHKNNLEEFKFGRDRLKDLDSSTVYDGVSSLSGQRETVRKEWLQKAAPALKEIDQIWINYENAQNSVATRKQMSEHPAFRIGQPRVARMDTSIINQIVPYFDMAVGICLLLGLFTPVAALAAAGFLGSVFLSQYPPTTGPSSSMYQLVECMACLVLAGTGAGRFAGLDFFLHLFVRRTYSPVSNEV
jgi:uncharacterized membrane protein YphA (DoxX/SURF4 family)